MLFVLVACLLTTVSGASTFCCTPPQWEGSMRVTVGSMTNDTNDLTEGTMKISYDSVNKMITTQQSLMVNGKPLIQTVVDDYKAGASYTIKSDGSCVRGMLGAWIPNCIPDNATQTLWYFGLGHDQVNVKGYHVDYGTYEIYLEVTSDTCVPVVENVVGTFSGVKIFEMISFANIEAGIKDRMVFNVPSRCLTAPIVQVPEIGKRSSPVR